MRTKTYPDPKAITDNGWYFLEICNCQRTLKYRYLHKDHPGLMLEWMPKFAQFSIKNGGLTKVSLTKTINLDATLKSL